MAHTPGAIDVAVRTADGWTLRGERLVAPDAPAVVVLGHAMMVDRRAMDRPPGDGLASALHSAGLDVIWLDCRGHGESGPLAHQGGRWTYDDIVRQDVPAFVRAGREVAGDRPVVLLGHSLVGHAALISAGLSPELAPDALVLYAPNLWAPSLEPSPLLRAGKGALLRAWRAAARAGGYFDPAPFGMGKTTESLGYVDGFTRLFTEGLGDYERALGEARIDVLAVASEGDVLLARVASVRRFVGLARNANVDWIVLTGEVAPDHMGFVTDPGSRTLWQKTADWILHRDA